MSKTKQFGLCLLFFLLMTRPEPAVVSQPVQTFTDTTRNVLAGVNDAESAIKPCNE